MTGLEYIRTVCPTTKVGREPLREDVMDAFEEGIAEGWKQCKEKQWKPSDEQMLVMEYIKNCFDFSKPSYREIFISVYKQLKAL